MRWYQVKIAIGSDHVGYGLKLHISEYLRSKGHEIVDYGTVGEERVDYPVYARMVGKAVASGECERGVLVCGTGVGISIAANKVRGIRAAVCSEPYSARLSRQHNDANIIAFGSRVVGASLAEMIVDEFFSVEYEGGRHQHRLDLISGMENEG
jgi:ribose 5-phosphate isomerase B